MPTCSRLLKSRLASSPQCLCSTDTNEDDAHVVAGCSGTGSVESKALIPGLWTRIVAKRGLSSSYTIYPSWVSAHLVQLAVGLIPNFIHHFLAGTESRMLPTVLKDFSLALCAHLAEVLRRRQYIVEAARPPPAASPPSSCSNSSSSIADVSRQLTVSDFRASEQHPPPHPSAAAPLATRTKLTAQSREATLALPEWIKRHPFYEHVLLSNGNLR